jgi:hypothetical protein
LASTPDAITLTVPTERRFAAVVRLVVGGLAARLDLPYEQVDDLQLAVETILARDLPAGETFTLEVNVDNAVAALRLGPLEEAIRDQLEPEDGERADELALGRLLASLVEEVRLLERGDDVWIELAKRVPQRPTSVAS